VCRHSCSVIRWSPAAAHARSARTLAWYGRMGDPHRCRTPSSPASPAPPGHGAPPSALSAGQTAGRGGRQPRSWARLAQQPGPIRGAHGSRRHSSSGPSSEELATRRFEGLHRARSPTPPLGWQRRQQGRRLPRVRHPITPPVPPRAAAGESGPLPPRRDATPAQRSSIWDRPRFEPKMACTPAQPYRAQQIAIRVG
jgi:hypothetical protein